MPNECQKPNANKIGWQHLVAIQLYIHMVIMVLGFTEACQDAPPGRAAMSGILILFPSLGGRGVRGGGR